GEPAEAEAAPAAAMAAEPAASQVKAAMASGKILPDVLPGALPEAAETDAEAGSVATNAPASPSTDAKAERATGDPADPLLALLGATASPSRTESRPEQSAAAPSTAHALPNLRGKKDVPADLRIIAETEPRASKEKAPGSRLTGAVQISVAQTSESTSASAERAALPEHKPGRPEQIRTDAPLLQVTQTAPVSAASADSISTLPGAQAVSAPAQVFAPADITAALDRLVAAREALMPAEAALAIDHSEFGKISIRFEQSPDGQLSAELRAADPEVQRAVTAAVATGRGFSMTSEVDGNRSLNRGNPRSASTGSDASSGERGQTGSDRQSNQRHELDRASARQGSNDPRPGIFA